MLDSGTSATLVKHVDMFHDVHPATHESAQLSSHSI